jgi:PKD repeat protein
VQYTYNAAGTNTVRLIVSGLGGSATNTKSGYIVVSSAGPPPPSASFNVSPTSGTEPLLVTFSDTSTGTITNRSWDFGDTTTTNVTTNIVAHTYAAGTYGVTLVVTGPGGVSTNSQLNYITALTAFQSWQVQYFGSTTNPAAVQNADPDGDGCNNLCEFLSGTDPTNSASFFHIIAVTPQSANILVTWATAGGRTNVVQVSGGDVDGSYTTNFVDLSPFIIIPGSGDAITNYLDSEGATNGPGRYYRVRLVP